MFQKLEEATNVNFSADPRCEQRGQPQNEFCSFGERELWQNHCEVPERQDHGTIHLRPAVDHRDGQDLDEQQPLRLLSSDGPSPPIGSSDSGGSSAVVCPATTSAQPLTSVDQPQHQQQQHQHQQQSLAELGLCPEPSLSDMLQQYQQQPDYTPYGSIGYGGGTQPNSGYFNYAASESWYGSPQGGDHATQMVRWFIVFDYFFLFV